MHLGGKYPGPRCKLEAAAPPLGRRMPMPKLSPEWQRPGDLGSARPDNHTTSRRCSGVSLGSTQRRLATCSVTIGPWGVSRDQRRGGAGAARRHDLHGGPPWNGPAIHTQKPPTCLTIMALWPSMELSCTAPRMFRFFKSVNERIPSSISNCARTYK